jgi:hypothetical protein
VIMHVGDCDDDGGDDDVGDCDDAPVATTLARSPLCGATQQQKRQYTQSAHECKMLVAATSSQRTRSTAPRKDIAQGPPLSATKRLAVKRNELLRAYHEEAH